MLTLVDSIIANRRYPASIAPPTSPVRGYPWTEIDSNGDFVQEWFWNGNYWLSFQTFEYIFANTTYNASNLNINRSRLDASRNMWLERAFGSFIFVGGTVNDVSNYWTFSLFSPPVSSPLLLDSRVLIASSSTFQTFSNSINLYVPQSTLNNSSYRRMQAQADKIGTPSDFQVHGGLIHRYAR